MNLTTYLENSTPLKVRGQDYMSLDRLGGHLLDSQKERSAKQEKEFDYLFICAANVGRSQMAEGLYNHYTGGQNSQSAAGIYDVGEKYKYRPHEGIIQVMRETGIDIYHHKIKFVSSELVQKCRKIVVLSGREEKCPFELLENIGYYHKDNIEFREVEDPHPRDARSPDYSQLLREFRKTRDTVDEMVKQLLYKEFTKAKDTFDKIVLRFLQAQLKVF